MEFSFEKLTEVHREKTIDIFNYYVMNTTYAYRENVVEYSHYDGFLESCKKYSGYAVINKENEVVGFGLLKPYAEISTFEESADLMYFIKEEYKGKGIGTKLLERIEEDAKSKGIKRLFASISSENEISIKFHLKNGFIECGRHTNAGKKFNRYFSIVWMVKEI